MTTKKIVYIAGPMTGLPKFNFPAFYAAEKALLKQGYQVVNPARMDNENGFNENTDKSTNEFIRKAFANDIQALSKCDAIYMLSGWRKSKGACAEYRIAVDIFDMEIL